MGFWVQRINLSTYATGTLRSHFNSNYVLVPKKQFRILFTVNETSEEDGGIVRIHRVRHGSQERLRHLEQLLDDDDE